MLVNKRKKWIIMLSVIVVLVLFVFSGMVFTEEIIPLKVPLAKKSLVIGWAPPDITPVFVSIGRAIEQEAEEAKRYGLDIEVITQACVEHTAFATQANIIENFITSKVDVIICSPIETGPITPAINEAAKAGIPIIIVNILADIPGMNVDAYVGYDNTEAGRLAGAWAVSRLNGSGKIAMIEGIAGGWFSTRRKDGFLSVTDVFPRIEIVGVRPGNWDRNDSMVAAEQLLTANPRIDLMFNACDEILMGALQAVESEGRGDEIIMQGYDATQEALKALADGRSEADLTLHLPDWGRRSVQCGVMLVNGIKVPKFNDMMVEVVDKGNLSEYYPAPQMHWTHLKWISTDWNRVLENPYTVFHPNWFEETGKEFPGDDKVRGTDVAPY
ncbi:hypothetical protein ES704_00884 [subsurface metagenome]|jgi:ribose transport system substrate-binding protein